MWGIVPDTLKIRQRQSAVGIGRYCGESWESWDLAVAAANTASTHKEIQALDGCVMQVGELLRPVTAALGQELLKGDPHRVLKSVDIAADPQDLWSFVHNGFEVPDRSPWSWPNTGRRMACIAVSVVFNLASAR